MKKKIIKIKWYHDTNKKCIGIAFSCTLIDSEGNTYDQIGHSFILWNDDYNRMIKSFCKGLNRNLKQELEYIPVSLFRQEFKKEFPQYKIIKT